MANISTLNQQFGIDEHLLFTKGPGDFTIAEVNNLHATTEIALHGAHVMSYQPRGQQPVLWGSQYSQYKVGKAIRGGIPVCWPWFAAHPTDPEKPAHGVARTRLWDVTGSDVVEDDATQIRFSLHDNAETQELWPHPFRLELVVTVGRTLDVELQIHNPGSEPFSCTGALHTYFDVSDIANVKIRGLENKRYVDKLDHDRQKVQQGPIVISAETDRIYLDAVADCLIEDAAWQRIIRVAKQGSQTTVVWNPWADKAKRMADFGDEEYHGMVCVETTNAADDVVVVPAGGSHTLRTTLSVEPR